MEEPAAYYTTKILERVINEGTGRRANIGRPAAGKTGTTSDNRDAWFGGYTPELATVVWMGHLESAKRIEPIEGRTVVGGSFPSEIWREFMARALQDRPVKDFISPEGELADVEVCLQSGLLPSLWCPEETLGFMIFVKSKEPTQFCDIHNKAVIPDILGQDIEIVKQVLSDMHFIINEIFEFNEIYNENIVFNTDPPPGQLIESINGQSPSINVYISKGLEAYDMPDLSGLTVEKAQNILASIGLSVNEIIYDFSNLQDEGKIFSQSPPAQSKVNRSMPITLYVSKGENPESIVPDVTGMTQQEAEAELAASGFNNLTFILEESDKAIDRVFSQVPGSGTVYTKNLEIIIKISKGIRVPSVIGMNKNDALNLLEGLGFTVSILPDSTATGDVIKQIPEADTFINYGQNVQIELDES